MLYVEGCYASLARLKAQGVKKPVVPAEFARFVGFLIKERLIRYEKLKLLHHILTGTLCRVCELIQHKWMGQTSYEMYALAFSSTVP